MYPPGVAAREQGLSAPPASIVLIGWDGAQRNHVREALDRGELPALRQLSKDGALVAIDIHRTTDTKAGWTQILTGYQPEVTGVFSNGRYGPIPAGLSVFERLEQAFGPGNIFTGAVIGKKGHVDNDPAGWERLATGANPGPDEEVITNRNGVRFRRAPAKPYFFTSQGMDYWQNGLGENEKVGTAALELIRQHQKAPFFIFIHFADVDHKGHQFGENSKEYNDALISSDLWTGRIVALLKELALYDQTAIYVTADHGFDEGQKNHADAPYVFLATNDPGVMRRGLREDITPTLYDRLGIDTREFNPPLDGRSLREPFSPPRW
jgi:predicted AlkP superfamily pyrophosphatase or phosphodiesterase